MYCRILRECFFIEIFLGKSFKNDYTVSSNCKKAGTGEEHEVYNICNTLL